MDLLKKVNRESGKSVVMVTHNMDLVKMTKKIIYIRDGAIENVEELGRLKWFLLILLLSILLLTVRDVSGQPVLVTTYNWGTLGHPLKARPGYEGVPLTVEAVEMPGYSIDYAQLDLYGTPIASSNGDPIAYAAPEPLETSLAVSNATATPGVSIPTITAGPSPVVLTFYLEISAGAKPGTYYGSLIIYYSNGGSQGTGYSQIKLTVYPQETVEIADVYWGNASHQVYPSPGYGLVPLTFYLEDPSDEPLLNVNVTAY